jgi:hypothetical protein
MEPKIVQRLPTTEVKARFGQIVHEVATTGSLLSSYCYREFAGRIKGSLKQIGTCTIYRVSGRRRCCYCGANSRRGIGRARWAEPPSRYRPGDRNAPEWCHGSVRRVCGRRVRGRASQSDSSWTNRGDHRWGNPPAGGRCGAHHRQKSQSCDHNRSHTGTDQWATHPDHPQPHSGSLSMGGHP